MLALLTVHLKLCMLSDYFWQLIVVFVKQLIFYVSYSPSEFISLRLYTEEAVDAVAQFEYECICIRN